MDIRSKLGLYRENLQVKPVKVCETGRDVHDLIPGSVRGNEYGSFYMVETRYPVYARHGGCSFDEAMSLRPEILSILSSDNRSAPVDRLLFLDTETTGLSGGAGTVAFLAGTGCFEDG